MWYIVAFIDGTVVCGSIGAGIMALVAVRKKV